MNRFQTRISLKTKTGFTLSEGDDVAVFDKSGKPFYIRKNVDGVFNLPKGLYFTNNILKVESKPRKYLVAKLPRKERNFNISVPKMKLTRNENKCSIDVRKSEIYMDVDFFESLNECERNFVIFHEIGHFLYSTETYADLYSVRQCLRLGFNPSQIGAAILNALDQRRNLHRSENLLKKWLKNKKHN